MVDAEAGVACEGVAPIVPEGEYGLAGVEMADGVGPALRQQAPVELPRLGLEESVVEPALGLVGVHILWDDVVVAGEDDGAIDLEKPFRMRDQPLEPAQFVVELGRPA